MDYKEKFATNDVNTSFLEQCRLSVSRKAGHQTCRLPYPSRSRRPHSPRRPGSLRQHVPRRTHLCTNQDLAPMAPEDQRQPEAVRRLCRAVPLVVSNSAEGVEKTQNAIKVLKHIGAYADAEKAKDSVGIRPGKGKMRNRRYISRKGPLVVCGTEGAKLVKAFRNIPGVEVANVERLNLLKLAPEIGSYVDIDCSQIALLLNEFGILHC